MSNFDFAAAIAARLKTCFSSLRGAAANPRLHGELLLAAGV